MKPLSPKLRLALEDLLGDLWHARRSGDLGRLALLSYFEVRRWARLSGEHDLDRHSSVLVTGFPYDGRDSFLAQVDSLIAHLEQVLSSDGVFPPDADEAPPSPRLRGGAKRLFGASA
ncbi:MAG: hypothetical protein ACXWCO_01770 [Caldimonas sp.]